MSSPKLRSHLSEVSSNSVGSSLDTASASAHLERYDMPWSSYDVNGIYRGAGPRRSRSYTAFLEWNAMNPVGRHHFKSIRPLGGASRRRLIRQIQQLTKDKADLQAQLTAMASVHSTSYKLAASKVAELSALQKKSESSVDGADGQKRRDQIVEGMDSIDVQDGVDGHSSDHPSSQSGEPPTSKYP